MNIYMFYISLSFYLLSTACYLLFLPVNKVIIEKLGHYALLSGFCIHFLATLVRYFNAGYTPITNIYESLSFFSLCIAGFFLYLKRIYRIEIIGCIILPVLSVLLIWAATFPAEIRPLPPVLKSYWLPVHTIFSFVGNAIFFVSFFISLLYLLVERGIKKKRFPSIAKRFPSLETLDLINYRCMSYGFPFLTVGIITGSIWASVAWGSYWSWDPKETWSLVTWIVYAMLIHNRLAIGWRGRKTAYMMIIGFFSILITFLGVNCFAGGLHSYL
jgi:cytochrome c-type biogenesis protein CcsB